MHARIHRTRDRLLAAATVLALALPALSDPLPALAGDAPDAPAAIDAQAAAPLDPIVGAWQAVLDASGDTIPAGLVFGSDGTVLVTTPEGLDGVAIGAWERDGAVYRVTVIAYVQGVTSPMVLRLSGRLGPDGTLAAEGTASLAPDGGEPDVRDITTTATRITLDGPVLPGPTPAPIGVPPAPSPAA
jgi:hypothetical protein